MKLDLETLYKTDPVRACQLALKRTSNELAEDRLEKLNKILHGYGTEAIRGDWQNGYWCDIVACYVNMGETYATTIIQIRGDYGYSSHFRVVVLGDWIEKNNKKYNLI